MATVTTTVAEPARWLSPSGWLAVRMALPAPVMLTRLPLTLATDGLELA